MSDALAEVQVPVVKPAFGLAGKLARVMGGVSRIKKSGFNQHFKYAFATDADVSDEVRSLLSDEGVAFLPSMDGFEDVRSDGKNHLIRVWFTMRFLDGVTGEELTCKWCSEAIDGQDKALNKAATAAVKYFLLKTFLISTGNEPDADADAPPEPTEKGWQRPSPGDQVRRVLPMRSAPPQQAPRAAEEPHPVERNNDFITNFMTRIASTKTADELVAVGNDVARAALEPETRKIIAHAYSAKRRGFDQRPPERQPGEDSDDAA